MNQKKKITINMLALYDIVRKDIRKIIIYGCVCGVIGVAIAFCIPKDYKTSVMLAPESSSNNLMGNISSLASMVGMDMNFGDSDDAIYPEIYPDLMKSTKFLVSLFDIKVKSQDGEIDTNLYDYILKNQKFAVWEYPLNWIKDAIKKMKGGEESGNGKVDPFCLSKEQSEVAKAITSRLSCEVDKKTSVITITVTTQDPLISATLADSVKERLQVFITEYRTQKARNDEAYMKKLYEEARADYAKARQQYAYFSDSNQEAMLQSIRSKQDDLENEMQLKYNIYTQVASQLQLARAKVQERTPAFTTVQNATVPIKHSNKPKILFLIGFGILGALIRVGMLSYRNKSSVFCME